MPWGRCWEEAKANPSKVGPEAASIVIMGNRPTTRDRYDTGYGKMRESLASEPAKQLFQDE